MANISLLGVQSRVETPFIAVKIGDYVFGVYDKRTMFTPAFDWFIVNGVFKTLHIKYPNYIRNLKVTKINGKVNQYTLDFVYPITQDADPNFFEKVFSSVSASREIMFSYGDMSTPQFVYKEENAIITNVRQQFQLASSVIQYTVDAVSTGNLLSAVPYNFSERYEKPSNVIKEILQTNMGGILDVFYGMRDFGLVIQSGLIPGNDDYVHLEAQTNMSVLAYISFLVKSMTRTSPNSDSNDIYTFTVIDDVSGKFGGPYFKIDRVSKQMDSLDTYEIEIGYPTSNIVTNFSINNNESYSIFYDYSKRLSTDEFVHRIDDQGNIYDMYSPAISSGNSHFETNQIDRNWWKNVTQYPITVNITLRGLLRPSILMTNVRLKVYFYGKKHTSSGLYVLTQQVDSIGVDGGFTTSLTLVRIDGDEYGSL